MPDDSKPRLHLDQCQELQRLRQMAERLGDALAGYLPGDRLQDAKSSRARHHNARAASLEQAMAHLDLQAEEVPEPE